MHMDEDNTRKLYWHPISGHAHRAELMLSLLGLPFARVEVNLLGGENKQPAFLAKNPLGQVPVLEDGDTLVADSNAILVYLALRYDGTGSYLPTQPLAAARVQRWLSLAAGDAANGPGQLRLATLLGLSLDRKRAQEITARLLSYMQACLAREPWLAGQGVTLADVALYTYVAHAPEGGVDLAPYPEVRRWLSQVQHLPGFVPMRVSAAPGRDG